MGRIRCATIPATCVARAHAGFIKAKHIETGACISAIAMSALTVASAALTHEAKLYLKPSHQYPVSPRLWTVLVGNPSAKKTPAIVGCTSPLRNFQSEMHARQLQEWREQLEAQGKSPDEEDYPRLQQYLVTLFVDITQTM